MMGAIGLPDFMSVISMGIMIAIVICAMGWLGYCISSIARAADALERIADAMEEDDEEKDGAE